MRHAKITFSEIEKFDLLKAWLATSIAFGIFFLVNGQGLADTGFFTFVLVIGIAAVTAGLGFIGHELMHKFTANHFGVQAEFRSNDSMLLVSILIAFLGIILAAPGAVQIYGSITRRENGLISAAGPAANIVLALLFLPIALFAQNPLAYSIGTKGLFINALLAIFNMIPVWQLDGSKVLQWSKAYYFLMVGVCAVLVVYAYTLVFL